MLDSEKSIPVSVLKELIWLDPDTGRLFWKTRSAKHFSGTEKRTAEHAAANWNSRYAGGEALANEQGSGHLYGRVFNRRIYAHRAAFAVTHDRWPRHSIDHINGDHKDNRPSNLRDVSHQVNHRNQVLRKNNTSGALGVSFNKRLQKWQASITINGRSVHLGFFEDKGAATDARIVAQKEFGFHENHGRKSA